jgi:ribonuclease HI
MDDAPVLTIHTDGAARGNPGPAAFAYVIELPDGSQIEEAGCLGRMTNNQAEYIGLVRALEHALQLGPHHRLTILSDSELMVKQMNGEYRVKNGDLKDLHDQAQELRKKFKAVHLRHVRRADNKQADRLCNDALDGKRAAQHEPALRAEVAGATAADPSPLPLSPQVRDVGVRGRDTPSLDEQALACLKDAAEAWSRGDPHDPTPAAVWMRLRKIIDRSGTRRRSRSQ